MNSKLSKAIGQLIIGKVPGTDLDEDTRSCLKNGIISGITLFKENIASPEQVMALCDAIYRNSFHPAIVTADQEGGAVQRLEGVASPLPSMMAIGRLADIERTKLVIALSAKQLRLLGLNCVLAPVLDVNTNPANPIIGTRSFGETTEIVSKLGATVIRTYLEAGVLPVAKHFPGHGDTSLDSHLELPTLEHSKERLYEIELSPFRDNLIITPAMLVAHLWVKCIDEEEIAATLSRNIITELLKKEMGFQNLVFSDDMLMKAITKKWGLADACVKAVSAGLDQLLVCSNPDDARTVHGAIVEAVKSGKISEQRIEQAVLSRTAALNKIPELENFDRARRISALTKSIAAAQDMLMETSASAIEVTRGLYRPVLNKEGQIDVFVPRSNRYDLNFTAELSKEIPTLAGRLIEHRFSLNPDESEISSLLEVCGSTCMLITFRASINRKQIDLANRLAEKCQDRLLIASDIPYDLDIICGWDNAMAIFDPSDLAVSAFARRISKQPKSSHVCED